MENYGIIETNDGSSTVLSKVSGDLYHSIHGAETESMYVYIEQGLLYSGNLFNELNILEVGLGTGLNLALCYENYLKLNISKVFYTTLEPLPLAKSLVQRLNYSFLNNKKSAGIYYLIHESEWSKVIEINSTFSFIKFKIKLEDYKVERQFQLIFYDAFGPEYQPEMWTIEMARKLSEMTCPGGILVTYCAQGDFRRNLETCGFKVERLKGPPGKRQMIRAIKI